MRGFIRIHYIIQLKCNLYAHCPLPSSGHPNITNFPHFAFLSHNHKYNKLLTLLTIQKAQYITYIRYLTAKHKNTTLTVMSYQRCLYLTIPWFEVHLKGEIRSEVDTERTLGQEKSQYSNHTIHFLFISVIYQCMCI